MGGVGVPAHPSTEVITPIPTALEDLGSCSLQSTSARPSCVTGDSSSVAGLGQGPQTPDPWWKCRVSSSLTGLERPHIEEDWAGGHICQTWLFTARKEKMPHVLRAEEGWSHVLHPGDGRHTGSSRHKVCSQALCERPRGLAAASPRTSYATLRAVFVSAYRMNYWHVRMRPAPSPVPVIKLFSREGSLLLLALLRPQL